MKAKDETKVKKSDEIKPEKDVLREPEQISFKDAMEKTVNTKYKKKRSDKL